MERKTKKRKIKEEEKDSSKIQTACKGDKLCHLFHPEQFLGDGGCIPRRCKTTSRAGALWAAPEMKTQMKPH